MKSVIWLRGFQICLSVTWKREKASKMKNWGKSVWLHIFILSSFISFIIISICGYVDVDDNFTFIFCCHRNWKGAIVLMFAWTNILKVSWTSMEWKTLVSLISMMLLCIELHIATLCFGGRYNLKRNSNPA